MNLPISISVPLTRKITLPEPADTEGSNVYVVALATGGLMEDPEITYRNYQYIFADTKEDAKRKYDRLNDCSFYYGVVLGRVTEDGVEWYK